MAIDYSVKDLTLAQKMAAYKQGGVNTTSSYIWNPAWKGTMGGMMLGSKDAYITNPYYLSANDWNAWNMQKGDALKTEYQTAYNEAKAANETRYQDILAGYKTRYSTAMADLAKTRTDITGKLASNREEVLSGLQGLGDAQLADIRRQAGYERSRATQGLVNSGLFNTTIAPSVIGGVGKRERYATDQALETLRREKLGYISQLGATELNALKSLSDTELAAKTGLSREELEFAERRTDEYPSESLYVQMMQQLGNA